MNTSDIIILATIIVYMAAMVVIGIVLSRRNSNVGGFGHEQLSSHGPPRTCLPHRRS